MLDLARRTALAACAAMAVLPAGAQAPPAAALELVEVSDTYKSGDLSMKYTVQVPKGAKAEHSAPFHNYLLMLDAANAVHVAIVAGPPGNLELAIKQQDDMEKYTSPIVERQSLAGGAVLVVTKAAPAIQTVHRFEKLAETSHVRIDCSGPPRFVETLKQMCASFRKGR